ncbi:mutS protein homolog 5-like [Oratosquilla oratoria]|uniref:mutS protein homolog 5-like n=1 Tax=Oratosquilla oratoria TaxID=337810 RepID=UPI003F757C0A
MGHNWLSRLLEYIGDQATQISLLFGKMNFPSYQKLDSAGNQCSAALTPLQNIVEIQGGPEGQLAKYLALVSSSDVTATSWTTRKDITETPGPELRVQSTSLFSTPGTDSTIAHGMHSIFSRNTLMTPHSAHKLLNTSSTTIDNNRQAKFPRLEHQSTSSTDSARILRTQNQSRNNSVVRKIHDISESSSSDKNLVRSSERKDIIVEDQSIDGEEMDNQTWTKSEEADTMVILSVHWGQKKLGAAFYDIQTAQVYIIEDRTEHSPDFHVLKSLFREIRPRWLLLDGRQNECLHTVVRDLCGLQANPEELDNMIIQSSRRRQFHLHDAMNSESEYGGCKLRILPVADFNYDLCRRRILSLKLPGEPENLTEDERELRVKGIVNVNLKNMTRALGALLRFLSDCSIELHAETNLNSTSVLGLHVYAMKDFLYIDEDTLKALHVFTEDQHPSAFKMGKKRASKEGFSLYALLCRTASPMSRQVLRKLLLRPVQDVETLQERHRALEWCLEPANQDIVKQLQLCMRHIHNVPHVIGQLQRVQMSVRDWKTLHTALYNGISIGELCQKQYQDVGLLQMQDHKHPKLLQSYDDAKLQLVRLAV